MMIALIRRDGPVAVLQHLRDGVHTKSAEAARHQDAEGYDPHPDPEDQPHPGDAVVVTQGYPTDSRGAAQYHCSHTTNIHKRAQPPSSDQEIVGAAGPSQAPVAGPDHDGEVEGQDHKV